MHQAKQVEVVPYNDQWPFLFEAEAKLIKEALGDNCLIIHHIGSTAVPNLSAKPIIDMIPVVKDIVRVKAAIPTMEKLGYESRGEYGLLFRHYFVKKQNEQSFNIHIYEENSPDIERHLKFRDWMRTHSDSREAYQALKIDLAAKFPYDIFNYVMGKDEFIESIDKKTGFDGLRLVLALKDQEWNVACHFRQKCFFDRIAIKDPYTSTFKEKDHAHIILYKGTQIIGYANIQFWLDNKASLRIIVIEEQYRNQGLGSQFLKLCERWLKIQGIQAIQIDSFPSTLSFFIQYGYVEMPLNDPDNWIRDPQNISLGKLL